MSSLGSAATSSTVPTCSPPLAITGTCAWTSIQETCGSSSSVISSTTIAPLGGRLASGCGGTGDGIGDHPLLLHRTDLLAEPRQALLLDGTVLRSRCRDIAPA